jgi:hypothetical protein
MERQHGGELVVLLARIAGEDGIDDPPFGDDDAPCQALVGPQRIGEANPGQGAHVRQSALLRALVAVTGTDAGTFFTQ